MRCLVAIFTLVLLSVEARADEPDADVRSVIDRGLTFLAKDNLAWKESKKCYECHHAPFTIWALNEAKNRGYPIDDKVLAEMTSWVVGEDYLARLLPKRTEQKEIVFDEAPLFLALGLEAGDTKATQDGLKQMLASVVHDQDQDGFWKRVNESRPILSSPDTLTTLALLALSAPNAPDLGEEGKAAKQKGLQWLQAASPDDELQPAALRLILWRHSAGRRPSGNRWPNNCKWLRTTTVAGAKSRTRRATPSPPARPSTRWPRQEQSRMMSPSGRRSRFSRNHRGRTGPGP